MLEHIEFMKFQGRMYPQGLSLVRFHSKEQLWELMDYCEAIGIWNANPHTHFLDEDVRWNGQPLLDAKAEWDPTGLLNPGHLKRISLKHDATTPPCPPRLAGHCRFDKTEGVVILPIAPSSNMAPTCRRSQTRCW
ncbi:MAG: hypothetical protein R2932_27385 [Caldilineaceae bacterium]